MSPLPLSLPLLPPPVAPSKLSAQPWPSYRSGADMSGRIKRVGLGNFVSLRREEEEFRLLVFGL